jgi:hypothetical protein
MTESAYKVVTNEMSSGDFESHFEQRIQRVKALILINELQVYDIDSEYSVYQVTDVNDAELSIQFDHKSI